MLSLTSPVKTPFHGVSPTAKLLALCAATVGLFYTEQWPTLVGSLIAVGGLYAICGRQFFRTGIARLKPLWVFVLVIAVWHILTDAMGEGIVILLRLATIVALANLVTMTTQVGALIELASRTFRPLRRFGLNPEVIGFSVGLVVRFIPVLTDRIESLATAWCARSTRRANWRILFPVFLTTIDDAEHLAEALRARGGLPSFK